MRTNVTIRTGVRVTGVRAMDTQYISAEEYEYRCISAGSTDGTLNGIEDAIDREELREEFQRMIDDRKQRQEDWNNRRATAQTNIETEVAEFIDRVAEQQENDREYYDTGFAKEQERTRLYYANRLKFERRRAAKRKHEKEQEAAEALRRERLSKREEQEEGQSTNPA